MHYNFNLGLKKLAAHFKKNLWLEIYQNWCMLKYDFWLITLSQFLFQFESDFMCLGD